MATRKQKEIARLIVINSSLAKPLNYGEIVEKGRYTKSMVIKPSVVIKSKGVQEELQKLGFNEYSAKKVVDEIMHDPNVDPGSRLKATDQVFKVVGSYAPEKKELSGSIKFGQLQELSNDELSKLAESSEK